MLVSGGGIGRLDAIPSNLLGPVDSSLKLPGKTQSHLLISIFIDVQLLLQVVPFLPIFEHIEELMIQLFFYCFLAQAILLEGSCVIGHQFLLFLIDDVLVDQGMELVGDHLAKLVGGYVEGCGGFPPYWQHFIYYLWNCDAVEDSARMHS